MENINLVVKIMIQRLTIVTVVVRMMIIIMNRNIVMIMVIIMIKKWLAFKGISKTICDLKLYVFLEGTRNSFTYNWPVSLQ